MNELLTRAEAAERLHISTDTLDRLRKGGKIAYVQHMQGGRVWFTDNAIQEYIARATHSAKADTAPKDTYRKRRKTERNTNYGT